MINSDEATDIGNFAGAAWNAVPTVKYSAVGLEPGADGPVADGGVKKKS